MVKLNNIMGGRQPAPRNFLCFVKYKIMPINKIMRKRDRNRIHN